MESCVLAGKRGGWWRERGVILSLIHKITWNRTQGKVTNCVTSPVMVPKCECMPFETGRKQFVCMHYWCNCDFCISFFVAIKMILDEPDLHIWFSFMVVSLYLHLFPPFLHVSVLLNVNLYRKCDENYKGEDDYQRRVISPTLVIDTNRTPLLVAFSLSWLPCFSWLHPKVGLHPAKPPALHPSSWVTFQTGPWGHSEGRHRTR